MKHSERNQFCGVCGAIVLCPNATPSAEAQNRVRCGHSDETDPQDRGTHFELVKDAVTPPAPSSDARALVENWFSEACSQGILDELAERVTTYAHQRYVAGLREAYENAAVIAENCTQDDSAHDEPFRIAQTIRHVALEKTNVAE